MINIVGLFSKNYFVRLRVNCTLDFGQFELAQTGATAKYLLSALGFYAAKH